VNAPLNVTPDNVLQARAVIVEEAQSLLDFVSTEFRSDRQLMGLCGGDPISRDAQRLFNQKIQETAVQPTLEYIRRLRDIADQLAATARSYGFTEQQITDSLRSSADANGAA
jgi:hypothetical protein